MRRSVDHPLVGWDEFRRRRRLWARSLLALPLCCLWVAGVALIQPDPRGPLAMALIGPWFVVVPAWFVAYTVLWFRVLHWRCPNCGDCFCSSWLVRWPWVSACVHCGYRTQSEEVRGRQTEGTPV
jgi:hypothetical protein